jgi:hypothetical protein
MAIDDALFQQLLAQPTASVDPAASAPAIAPAAPAGAVEPPSPQPEPQTAAASPRKATQADGASAEDLAKQGRDALGKPSDFLDAAVAGAGRAVLETKDFIAGEPTQKSETRQAFEAGAKAADASGGANPVISTISQFATGMLGAGKLLGAGRLIPKVDAAVGAAEAVKGGAFAVTSARAAASNAVVFDPHQERLSNLLEQVPYLGPPVFGWLAAHPDDPAWEGRVKAALEGIGLDATLAGLFLASAKGLKAYRAWQDGRGSAETVEAATKDLEAAQAQHAEAEAAGAPQEGATATEAPGATPVAATPGEAPTAAPARPTSMAEDTGFAPSNDNTLGGPPLDAPGTPATPAIEPGKPTVKPVVTVTPEEADSLVLGIRSDLDAIDNAGSVQGAVDDGHVFGRGGNVPWNKLNLPGEVDDFVARVADSIEPQLNAAKGGEVLSDARVQRQVNGIASYFNMDPATIVGRIQQSGEAASRMVADMEAAYLVANRMHTEAFNLASRISLGDVATFGTREAAMAEFQRQVTLAGSMFASGQSMRAAMGRGMRRLRPEFAIDPEMAERVNALGGEKLLNLFNTTRGDPAKLKLAANKTFLEKAMDEAGFLVQNNLLWSPVTHAVNLVSNAAMMVIRPVERVIGGVANAGYQAVRGNLDAAGESLGLVREAMEQAVYYPAAFVDGFGSVVQALKTSQSVMDPRHAALIGEARGAAVRDGAFRPLDSVSSVLHDAYMLVTLPTRLLTASDEMMKQAVYRSYVASKAWREGSEAGLAGRDLRGFIKDKMNGAFNETGQAIDMAAMQEARVATFAQDLLPGTRGKTLRGAVATHPELRLILPFTQTPTNIFRYTVKMSPGFNMMQEEFRSAMFGKQGVEAQAQAIGQMSLGSLALGAIATSGLNMTGGGPSDPKVKAEMVGSGWRPYSIVGSGADGTKTYYPIGRVDPLALPFGIVADIQDYIHASGDPNASKVQAAISTLAYSLVKQVASKTYILGLTHVMEAFTDPDRNLSKFAAGVGSEVIPFSSAMRFGNPDPYLREVRTFVDGMMANLPGFSEKLNPRRDWAGEPVRARNTFLSTAPGDHLTAELQRMEMLGYSPVGPTPDMKHADLRDVTMTNGRNAWDVYQELAGKPTPSSPTVREQAEKVVNTAAYQRAPDGPIDVPGTKMFLLHNPMIAYRKAAEGLLLRDENVRKAVLAAQQKVVDAYKATENTGKAPAAVQGARDTLGAVGSAFGLNLTPQQ